MPVNIEHHHVIAFGRNLSMAPQTGEFKLKDTVETDLGFTEPGEYFTDEIIGKSNPQPKTQRIGPTPSKEPTRSRRIGAFYPIEDANWLGDTIDKIRTQVVDAGGAIVTSMRMGIYRERDRFIMNSLVAPAREGKTGETSVAFPAGNILTNSGKLTIAKLRSARKALENGKVPGQNFWIGGQSDLDHLFESTEINSTDYNIVRALHAGAVNEFHSFTFKWFADDEVIITAATKRRNIAYKRTGNQYKGRPIVGGENARIWERADYSGAMEAYLAVDHGFLRRHDESVMVHDCDDT